MQAFGRAGSEVKRFGKAGAKDLSSGLMAARLEGRLMLISEIAIGFAAVAVVGLAVIRIRSHFQRCTNELYDQQRCRVVTIGKNVWQMCGCVSECYSSRVS